MGLMFGQFLRRTREDKGLTLREFAKRIGVSASYVCDVEFGHRNPPDIEKLKRMADILECGVQELVQTKTLDSGRVVLNFNADETVKAELAIKLEAEWNNITLDEATLLLMLLKGELEDLWEEACQKPE